MGGSFDGTGKPNEGPSWRAVIIAFVVIAVGVSLFMIAPFWFGSQGP